MKNVGINTLNFVGSGNSLITSLQQTLLMSVSQDQVEVEEVSQKHRHQFQLRVQQVVSLKASKRSASVLAQITQGLVYQVGRYLVIHDGTTVTTVEESAVTGSMFGTFEGVIMVMMLNSESR